MLTQREIRERYGLGEDTLLNAFADLESLGVVKPSGEHSVTVLSSSLKEMMEAYEIRAGLEEIAGRTAAAFLEGNTAALQSEVDGMLAAARSEDLEAYAEHDINFHRIILEASQNGVLRRVWDTLAIDLRMHAAIPKVSRDLYDSAESHRPIANALEEGRGREAGLLLRNHVETILEYLKRSESDSRDPADVSQRSRRCEGSSTGLLTPPDHLDSLHLLPNLLSTGKRDRRRLLRFTFFADGAVGDRHWRRIGKRNRRRFDYGQSPGFS